VQRAAAGPAPSVAPPVVDHVVASAGSALPATTLLRFENALGQDFSAVRIHTDAEAARSADAVNALAYTVGNHVVFGAGQFAPHTPRGAHLLAHELAHTVQQRGLQRFPGPIPMAIGSEDARLEAEADRFASQIAGPLTSAARPVLSRVPRTWTAITPAGSPLLALATDQESDGGTRMAFKMARPFNVPAGKGPVQGLYSGRATAGALEATIGFTGSSPNAALWQSRASTADLREAWLLKVGWTTANAAANWFAAGGENPGASGFPRVNPRAGGSSCDMDHIVELQMGGTNQRENVAPLNSTDNQGSGREIWNQVSTLASQIYDNLPTPKPTEVTLHFTSANESALPAAPTGCSAAGAAPNCSAVDKCATSQRPASLNQDGATVGTAENYVVRVGASDVTFRIAPGAGTTDLLNSGPENLNSAEAVPGVILLSLTRNAGVAVTMVGAIESAAYIKRTKPTRVPLAIAAAGNNIPFRVTAEGANKVLRLNTPPSNLSFTYPYLSAGQITRLTYSAERGLQAAGWIEPSIPMLRRVNINVAEGAINATINVDPTRFQRIVPGVRVTRSDIAVALSPQLSATGTLEFSIGSSVTGSLTASVDDTGFVAQGTLRASIPGVDNAQGNITYRNHEWTGAIMVDSTQIRLPGVERASITVGFNNTGVYATGGVSLRLPNGTPIELNVSRNNRGAWVYSGSTTIELPRMRPLNLQLSYDGQHITGTARTGVTIRGFSGDFTVRYNDGNFSGRGDLTFRLGRAAGTATVNISPTGAFSGSGSLTYPLTPTLTGTIGLAISESGLVRATGELTFANAITLFEGIRRDITIFTLPTIEIPILAIPIGPRSIGLVGTIDANLRANFSVGPGQLRDTRARAALNPLADNPDLEAEFSTRLVIPAQAGISATIRGGIGVSAGIGSITGGLNVTGSAALRGGLDVPFTIRYARGVFVAEAVAAIEAGLILGLDLTADVTARVGAFGLEYAKRWEWPLAGYRFDPGLSFRIAAPIRYASNEPFRAPSVDDIQFTPPRLDFGALVPRLFGAANQTESQA
jgi:hypothetical protein